jgi:hypothetical protein
MFRGTFTTFNNESFNTKKVNLFQDKTTSDLLTKHTISNDFITLDYRASVNQGFLNIDMKFEKNNLIESHSFSIDVSSKGYRLNISDKLKNYSKELFNNYSSLEAKLISQSITSFLDTYEEPNDFIKEELQGLFYIRSMFNAIYRAKESQLFRTDNSLSNIEIHSYEGYITGLSPYHAKEDIQLDMNDFQNWLDNYSGSRLPDEDILYIKSKVNGLNTLTLMEYQNIVHKPLGQLNDASNKNSQRCWILCGGDCGCCGNYDGQCYYGHVLCYAHDYLCQSCSPSWFCFSGCEATPC